MGKELIIRSNNGVTLTPTGRLMYYYAQSILSQFQVLERLKDVSEEKLYSKLTVSVDSVFLRDDLILQAYEISNYRDSYGRNNGGAGVGQCQ